MKKLFIIVSIVFSIFMFSDNVFALEFETNDNTYQVNSVESLRDYVYFHYIKDSSYNGFAIFDIPTGTCSGISYCNSYYFAILSNGSNFYFTSHPGLNYVNKTIYFNKNFEFVKETTPSGGTFKTLPSYDSVNFYYSNVNIYSSNSFKNISFQSNFSSQDIEDKYNIPSEPTYYTITYYLNNEVYREVEVEEGSSHTLIYYEPDPTYNFSGWSYDNNVNLSSIQSDITITGTTTLKPYYTISYYLNSEIYNSVSVIEGTNYSLVDYVPPKNYQFSGWSYDSNIDLTNITQNVNIFGTSVYVRPQMTYNEESDSIIHNLSYEILGNDVPVEFDYVYTLVDYLILLILVFCALVPFIIVFKLLNF